jgi:hypothetical protein
MGPDHPVAGRERARARAGIAIALASIGSLASSATGADVVIDWNRHGFELAHRNRTATMTIAHLAMYDAVMAVVGGHRPYAIRPAVALPASPEAAAAQAAHDVYAADDPRQAAAYAGRLATSLAAIPDGPAKNNGIALGRAVAAGMLAHRAGDGRFGTASHAPGSGPGAWIPTPPKFLAAAVPQWARIRPFLLPSPSAVRPGGPPALDSQEWADNYNEVKDYGGRHRSLRSPEQTATGIFYLWGTNDVFPVAIREVAIARHLSLAENARYFALVMSAYQDGIIANWDSKVHYNFWRPVTAIRAGDTDGNPATEKDPDWAPLADVFGGTPNHPEYTAGHVAWMGAGALAMARFFGTRQVAISIETKVPQALLPPGAARVRTYADVDEFLEEVVDSRVWAGVHYRVSDVHAKSIAEGVVRHLDSGFFQPDPAKSPGPPG